MQHAGLYASLENAPSPPSTTNGATMCELKSKLITIQTTLDSTKDRYANQLQLQARISTQDIINKLPIINMTQQNPVVPVETQTGSFLTVGRSRRTSGHRRSITNSLYMPNTNPSAFLSSNSRIMIYHINTNLLQIIERYITDYKEKWLPYLQNLVEKRNATENNSKSLFDKVLPIVAQSLLCVHSSFSNCYTSLYPALLVSGEELIERYTSTRNWSTAPVKCLAWHPHIAKIAVATEDDSIQVHAPSGNGMPGEGVSPVLKYKQQRGVSCMQWRPFLASELAVGCSTGLLIWNVDPCSVVARPSAGSVSHLQSPGHSPVTAISWHSNGSLLLSSAASDTSLILWNTASETKVPLRRLGAGFHMVLWSPNPELIFSATTSTVFRVWYTSKMWTSERWNVLGGYVNTACWSPDGTTLLFTTSTDPKIFCLKFMPSIVGTEMTDPSNMSDGNSVPEEPSWHSSGAAVPVMDLTAVSFNCEDGEEISTGGLVQSMKWDPSGERVVVSFRSQKTEPTLDEDIAYEDSGLLCVFSSKVTSSNIVLAPLGFIRGDPDETPITFEFAKHFKLGALLTIAWSSGRIQHLPMFFSITPTMPIGAGLNVGLQHNFNETNFPSHLSTSHLLNNSLNALTDFEPQLFSSPSVK